MNRPSHTTSTKCQYQATAGSQRVVGDGDRESAGEQDRGVERGYAEGGDGAEGGVGVAADVSRAVGRPDALELRPQDEVGEHLDALAAEPRHRQHARVE